MAKIYHSGVRDMHEYKMEDDIFTLVDASRCAKINEIWTIQE